MCDGRFPQSRFPQCNSLGTKGKKRPKPPSLIFSPLSSSSAYSFQPPLPRPPPPPPRCLEKKDFILTVLPGHELHSNGALIVWRHLDPVFVSLSLLLLPSPLHRDTSSCSCNGTRKASLSRLELLLFLVWEDVRR